MRYWLTFLLFVVSLSVDAQSVDSTHSTKPDSIQSDSIHILIYIPLDSYGECNNDPVLRRAQVDSLLQKSNAAFIRQDALASLAVQLTYVCPVQIDLLLLETQLQIICSAITIQRP